jgi:hypothetical protein
MPLASSIAFSFRTKYRLRFSFMISSTGLCVPTCSAIALIIRQMIFISEPYQFRGQPLDHERWRPLPQPFCKPPLYTRTQRSRKIATKRACASCRWVRAQNTILSAPESRTCNSPCVSHRFERTQWIAPVDADVHEKPSSTKMPAPGHALVATGRVFALFNEAHEVKL